MGGRGGLWLAGGGVSAQLAIPGEIKGCPKGCPTSQLVTIGTIQKVPLYRDFISGPGRTRTYDRRIMSPLL